MKIVQMPNVRQTWKQITSRVFRVFFKVDGRWTRQLDVIEIRGLLYPAGMETDTTENHLIREGYDVGDN